MSYSKNALVPTEELLAEKLVAVSFPLPSHCPATLIQLSENTVDGMFVAGGSCITILNPYHQYGDFDIYVNNKRAQRHAVDMLTSLEFTKTNSIEAFLTEWTDGLNKVQIIEGKKINNIAELFSTFDLHLCQIGFDHENVSFTKKCENNVANKTVTLSKKAHDDYYGTFDRLLKYASKGYIAKSEVVKHLLDSMQLKAGAPVLTRREITDRVNGYMNDYSPDPTGDFLVYKTTTTSTHT